MQPLISVIIPHGPGGNIDYTLDSLKRVNYPKDKIEVIAVEGKAPSTQRNRGVDASCGEFLFFFDDDVKVGRETINRLLSHYKKGIACVGGPNLTPEDDRILQKAFGYAMSSSFGAAKMSVRYKAVGEVREADETDLILCNLSADKKIFQEMGGFPHDFYPNEENVFFNRLMEKGYKLLYDPQAIVYHKRRANLRKTIKQMFSYGRGRFQQTCAQPKSFKPIFLGPSLFVLYLASLAFYPNQLYFLALWAYLCLDALFSLWASLKNRDYIQLLVLPWMYPLIHMSYGLGFMYGFLRLLLTKRAGKEPDASKIKVEKIKL